MWIGLVVVCAACVCVFVDRVVDTTCFVRVFFASAI